MSYATMDLAIMADRVRELRADARRAQGAQQSRSLYTSRGRKPRKSHR